VGIAKDIVPEFDAPPLNEVVMGVQFQPAANYNQLMAYEVWQLYNQDFPVVREQPPLLPQFETFGLPFASQMNLNMVTGPVHDRFWFTTPNGEQLIQFQQDRLLHNWRKVEPNATDYPRFESIIKQFEKELGALEGYYMGLGNKAGLAITQCELSYLNHIVLDDIAEPFLPQKWFSFVGQNQLPVDDFGATCKYILKDEEGRPYGRLHRESATGVDGHGRKIVTLFLTARGLPRQGSIGGALDFMTKHRHMIAKEFLNSTTDFAQQLWKRTQ
jgi:uncharacterized protein (TIGR04255 family)